ncbi:MAG: hypothetical protein RMI51_06515, partial [Aquificaceae bacterium]|nr:hypothetical protein [Aquificaceae bacterium]
MFFGNGRIKELEREVEKCREELEKKQSNIKKLQERIEELEEENSKKDAELNALKDNMQKLMEEKAQIEKRLIEAQEEYKKQLEKVMSETEEIREKNHLAWQIIQSLQYEGVFLADTEFKPGREGNRITFVNNAGKSIIERFSPEIERTYGYKITASNIEGQSIHIFHKNPDRVKDLLKGTKPGEIKRNADIIVG